MKALLRALVGGPLWVDVQVQRLVDAGMHALMRRGVSKALIRYVLHAVVIITGVATEVTRFATGRESAAWLWVTAAAVIAWLMTQYLNRKIDDREAARALPMDRPGSSMKAMWWLILALDTARWLNWLGPIGVFIGRPGLWMDYLCAATCFDVAGLLVTYSGWTPPRPPARRERAVLVPARAGGGA